MTVPNSLKPSRGRRLNQRFELAIYRIVNSRKLKYKFIFIGSVEIFEISYFYTHSRLINSRNRKFRRWAQKYMFTKRAILINRIILVIQLYLVYLVISFILNIYRIIFKNMRNK